MRYALPFLLCFVTAAEAQTFTPSTRGKKLIKYGQDFPNTAYVRDHISEMEKLPFDGVVIGITKTPEPKLGGSAIGHRAFGRERFDPQDCQRAIGDLCATKFQRFTDNFILFEAMPGDVDFYDDAGWQTIIAHVADLARVARQGGCVGLEFDPEEYSDEHPWTFTAWPESHKRNGDEAGYVGKARERGQQMMRAINAEFPRVKILCLLGPAFSNSYLKGSSHKYRLLAPFIEGMCSAADNGTQIIDGYEQSYGYRIPLAFEFGRRSVLEARDAFEDKAAFDRVMRVGFGLWLDKDSGTRGWFPDEPPQNHFTPQTWQTAVNGALSYSGEYVWLWNERLNWWTRDHLSNAYIDATRRARDGPAEPLRAKNLPRFVRMAAQIKGHDDQSTFGDLLNSHRLLVDLSSARWHFRPDLKSAGVDQKWFESPGNADWASIEIGQFWEEQGWDLDGYGWYRTEFDLGTIQSGKQVTLAIGAADETADVWLNGERVGRHDEGERGWDQRFTCDLTRSARTGKNLLVIRVLDLNGPGGLWKSVKVFTDR